MTLGWQTLSQVLAMKNLCVSLYIISGLITCLISGLAFSAEVKKTDKDNFFIEIKPPLPDYRQRLDQNFYPLRKYSNRKIYNRLGFLLDLGTILLI